jgi:uncharacterized protein YjeT (DUF2065 family)
MKLLLTLIGIVFIFEGLPYLTFPHVMQKWMAQLASMPAGQLRAIGLLAVGLGLFLCFITQRTEWFH